MIKWYGYIIAHPYLKQITKNINSLYFTGLRQTGINELIETMLDVGTLGIQMQI